jgi:hypothetical protein
MPRYTPRAPGRFQVSHYQTLREESVGKPHRVGVLVDNKFYEAYGATKLEAVKAAWGKYMSYLRAKRGKR